MKFKKAFAWILAVAMIISLMPSMAFASTTNSVDAVPTVSADSAMPQKTVIALKVSDETGWEANDAQKIKLTLENATWSNNPVNDDGGVQIIEGVNTAPDNAILKVGSPVDSVDFVAASDNTLEFSFKSSSAVAKDEVITLTVTPGAIKAGTEAGPVNVVIDGLDSKVTSQTITIANVATSNTVTNVTGTVKTYPRGSVTVSGKNSLGTAIEIRETAVDSLKNGSDQSLTLSLPKGVSFDAKADWEFSGDLVSASNISNITVNPVNSDGRVVEIKFKVDGLNTVRNVLVIKPSITISRDANEGDIAVQLIGGTHVNYTKADDNKISDASDLVIAKYGNESVTVSTKEEIPTFVSGYLKNTKSKDFTFEVTLKENMVKSLAAGRYVDFDLPEEVQICGPVNVKIGSSAFAKPNAGYVTIGDIDANTASANNGDSTKDANELSYTDESIFSFLVPNANDNIGPGTWSGTKANTITFRVPVTVQTNYAGDITCVVSGAKAGVDETELVVAVAESPITVTTSTTEVKNGVQTQSVMDITITENYAGYLDDTAGKNEIWLDIDTLGLTKGMVFEAFDSITVVDDGGDLELGKCKIDAGSVLGEDVIKIPVKHSSSKASTIELKGLVVALNRTLPEGPYDLQVYGDALVKNKAYNDNDFDVPTVVVEDYVVITTPAEGGIYNSVDSKFVIGETSFTVNGETYEMDAAAYIDENDRTMVPIRYFAMACGIDEDAISWDQASQTATITTPARVIKITMGQDTIWVSDGTNIQMDTVAVNKADRIYVPARFMANALGYEVEWDNATRTVSIF